MSQGLPLWKRLLFTAVILLIFLALLEGALALVPRLIHHRRGTVAVGPDSASVVVYCAGDSVTYGMDLDIQQSYPWQLAEKLKKRGLQDTAVLMYARPGAVASTLTVNLGPELQQLPASKRPIVYAMFGHNDFFDWDAGTTRGAFDGVYAPADPRNAHNLRILRILDWFRTAAEGTAPNLDLNPGNLGMMERALRETDAWLRGRGGALIVMTYVVPPEPPADLPANTARIIHLTHTGQPVINARVRGMASDLGIEVLDLERRIDTGGVWSTTWWVDNIHLSAKGLGRVAEEVEGHLMTSGVLAPIPIHSHDSSVTREASTHTRPQ